MSVARQWGLEGVRPLFAKEVLRFWKVSFQTVAAPVLTSVLYLLIFGHVLEDRVQVFEGVGYTRFLIPGLVMMSLLQNAFANTSSSLIQSKITGNLVFVLLPPEIVRDEDAAQPHALRLAHPSHQAHDDPENHREQHPGHHRVEGEQHRVVLLVQLPALGGLGQQKQQHHAQPEHGEHRLRPEDAPARQVPVPQSATPAG